MAYLQTLSGAETSLQIRHIFFLLRGGSGAMLKTCQDWKFLRSSQGPEQKPFGSPIASVLSARTPTAAVPPKTEDFLASVSRIHPRLDFLTMKTASAASPIVASLAARTLTSANLQKRNL